MVYAAFTVETLLVFVYKLLTNSVAQPAAAAAPRSCDQQLIQYNSSCDQLWYVLYNRSL